MKRLFYSIIIGALVSTLAIGAEVRKLGEYDLSWGPFGTTWTSPAGKVVRYLPRYFDNNAFADNLALYGKSLTGDGSGSITGFNIPLYISQYLSVLDAVNATPPSSKTDNCITGMFGKDNTYLYWCYSDNNWRRVAYDNTW